MDAVDARRVAFTSSERSGVCGEGVSRVEEGAEGASSGAAAKRGVWLSHGRGVALVPSGVGRPRGWRKKRRGMEGGAGRDEGWEKALG